MGEVVFRDGHIVPIKSYFRYSPGHVELYTADGDHYIYIETEANVYGKKYVAGEFFKRIMIFEEGIPDPYSIEYITDESIETVIFSVYEE